MSDGLLERGEAHIEALLFCTLHPCQPLHQATCCDAVMMREDNAHQWRGKSARASYVLQRYVFRDQ